MHAAVVTSFDTPPHFDTFPDPLASGDHEIVVDVVAAGLHPRVRSGADGSHYTSTGRLPMVPGVDAVGRTSGGALIYFVADDDAVGTMAERAVVDDRRSVALPADVDVAAIAAGMNPAMSSWIALRRRVDFRSGQRVLVLGATGNAGQMAVQIAKHLGAALVVGAGRDAQRLAVLPSLGADATVALTGEPDDVAARLAAVAADVDVVIDYLWGAPAEQAMVALVRSRADRSAPLRWVQIGSVAGPRASLPSELLRAANLQLLGSGQGSVTTAGIVAELPMLAERIGDGTLQVDATPVPLADVEHAWTAPVRPGQRVVFTP